MSKSMSLTATIAASYWQVAYGALACLILELTLPASRHSLASRLRGAWFVLVYVAITTTAYAGLNRALARLGAAPLFVVNLNPLSSTGALGSAAAIVLAMIFGDFFYYWFHRLQHAVPLLWRFHAVHHSIREMSAWNAYHHVTEELWRIPFTVLPVALLIRVDSHAIPWVFAIFATHGVFIHSCTRLHLGPFRYVVTDPRYHRLHHSTNPKHFGCNFGGATAVWDWLFGTLRRPCPGEWPEVGLDGIDEPRTLGEYLWRPFRQSLRAE
jgi:sterol desaturase/sphingolipid hydroxylase (fatty acid hydroxylase superfamily)